MILGEFSQKTLDYLFFSAVVEPFLIHPYVPGLPCFLRKEFYQYDDRGDEKELNRATTATYLQVAQMREKGEND